MQYQEYNYSELVKGNYKSKSARNNIVTIEEVDNFIASADKHQGEAYRSLFQFNDEMKKHVTETESVKAFKGSVYCDYLAFDFDRDDLNDALKDTKYVLGRLQHEYQIPEQCLRVFFSGSKGFHLLVPANVFRFQPSDDLPAICYALAKEIVGDITIDKALYQTIRLFRIPNTVNNKSGLFKIELKPAEVSLAENMDAIKELAKAPRGYNRLQDPEFDVTCAEDELSELCKRITEECRSGGKAAKKEYTIQRTGHDYDAIFNGELGDGGRTGNLIVLAGHWWQNNVELDAAQQMAVTWDIQNELGLDSDPQYTSQYPEGKVRGTVRSIYESNTAKDPTKKYFDDKRFVARYLADELMLEYEFLHTGGQLYTYTDGVFLPTGRQFLEKECSTRLGKHASSFRVNEVVADIKRLKYIDADELNTHKDLINLRNGMLNSREASGGVHELLPHSPEYLSTMQIPVKYDPSIVYEESNAGRGAVISFLATTLPGDCVELAYQIFGYLLIPSTRYQKSIMLTGGGENGKSTFINLVTAFIGSSNVSTVPLQELCDHRFKRADLLGKLANVFADLDAKAIQSSSYFKLITAGDSIDAERKGQDPFYFRPHARMIYSANTIPVSHDTSHAYHRRWIIIPFRNKFTGADDNKNILQEITTDEELSLLLNLALTGLDKLHADECFIETEATQEEQKRYIRQNDTVTAFLDEVCVFEGQIKRGDIYARYVEYCEFEGFARVTNQEFYNGIRAKGISEKRQTDGNYFIGISVPDENAPETVQDDLIERLEKETDGE